MNGSVPQPTGATTTSTPVSKTPIIMLLVVLIFGLVVGLVIGIIVSQLVLKTETKVSTGNLESDPNTPGALEDPSKVLVNPIFTEWWGSVDGKLVSKDSESFTIESNGSSLKIYIQDNLTSFYREATRNAQTPLLALDEIPVGAHLRGTVIISKGSLTGKADQHISGSGFKVVSETFE